MGVIKLYENFENYSEIDSIEYNLLAKRKRLDFSSKELSNIGNNYENDILGKGKLMISDGSECLIISKYEDEWFTVAAGDEVYYKCDQFESLIKCIKEI